MLNLFLFSMQEEAFRSVVDEVQMQHERLTAVYK